jgi:molybdate transport system substrate-binding protein
MRTMAGTFARRAAVALTSIVAIAATLNADDIKVVTSGTFRAAYLALAPEYERMTKFKLETEFGSSMGETYNAVPMRLNRGEAVDVVIMFAPALSDLIKIGKVRTDSMVDLAQSSIAMAVQAGTPKPDISTIDALKRSLLAAKSIAYSDSDSGVYLSSELFPRLGIADQMKSKSRKVKAEPVGEAVARGEFEMGFQQLSELLPLKGIEVVGELPPGAQRITVAAAGIPVAAKHPEAAKALIQWLASPAAYAAIRKSGLQPAKSTYK